MLAAVPTQLLFVESGLATMPVVTRRGLQVGRGYARVVCAEPAENFPAVEVRHCSNNNHTSARKWCYREI